MAFRSTFLSINVRYQQLRYIHKYPVLLSMYFHRHNFYKRKMFLNKNILLNSNKKCLSDNNYNSDTDQNEIEDEDIEVTDQLGRISVRNILYKNSKDPLINQLNNCASVQNVFDIIRNNYTSLNLQHICQAVLVLWDLQKIFYKHNILYESTSNQLLSTTKILKNYTQQINAHEDFEKLLQLVAQNYKKFTLDELTCILLYLNRMGITLKNPILQQMIQRFEEEIPNCNKSYFPLTALSRFLVTVYNRDSLWSVLVSINAMPVILHRLETCNTGEDLKLITICLLKLHQLVTKENLDNYEQVSNKLINDGVIREFHHRTILKSLRFLNQPQWHEHNSRITKKYMYLLKGQVNQLNCKEVVLLFKIFQIQKEPADMLEEIQENASKLLSDMKGELNGSLEVMLDLLSCIVSFASPLQRPRFEKLAEKYISNYSKLYPLTSLYRILYYLKLSDVKICNQFWDKFLQFIKKDNTESKLENLLNLSHKYIHFTNDSANLYRYNKFEKDVTDLLLHQLDSNILSMTATNFSKIASFLLTFYNDQIVLTEVVERLIKISHNLNSLDCLNISKGFNKIANAKHKTNNLAENFETLNLKLNHYTLNEINKNIALPKVNNLLKAYVYRKRNTDLELFEKLINNYITKSEELSSPLLKDLSYSLQTTDYLMPKAVDLLANYVVKNDESVLGSTVDKVLCLCYSLGYTPENYDSFLDVAGELIIRDKERFSGLAFLQSCLALCYFQKLPDSLIKQIFSVEFLETLDVELSNCYSKAVYPIRVRNHLMQLNRAVCLDYPGSEVPWFHQKYVEDIKNRKVHKKDYFHKKVSTTLSEIFGNAENMVSEDIFTPYGYHVDFEVKYNEKIEVNNISRDLARAAIILLTPKSYTSGTSNLKGYYQLKQRHLEILGYKVIGINYHEWKNFYTQQSCVQYVKNKLWSSTNADTTVSYV